MIEKKPDGNNHQGKYQTIEKCLDKASILLKSLTIKKFILISLGIIANIVGNISIFQLLYRYWFGTSYTGVITNIYLCLAIVYIIAVVMIFCLYIFAAPISEKSHLDIFYKNISIMSILSLFMITMTFSVCAICNYKESESRHLSLRNSQPAGEGATILPPSEESLSEEPSEVVVTIPQGEGLIAQSPSRDAFIWDAKFWNRQNENLLNQHY